MKKRVALAIILSLVAFVSAYFALEAYANVKLKEKFDRRLSRLPYATSYSRFHYSLGPNDLEIDGLTVKGELFSGRFQKLVVDLPFDFREKKFPPYLRVVVRGGELRLELPVLDELLGRSSFKFDLNGGYRFTGRVFYSYFLLNLYGMGSFTFKTEIDNLDYPTVERFFEGRTTVNPILRKGELSHLEIVFKNGGLYETFLNYAAKQEGTTPEKIKEELKSMVDQSFKDREIYNRIGEPLKEFINNPSCLKLEIQPPKPVSLKELKILAASKLKVKELVKELGLRLSVCD